jgi:hypothetical protein
VEPETVVPKKFSRPASVPCERGFHSGMAMVNMAKTEGYLHFGNLDMKSGIPVKGQCSVCGRPFVGTPKLGERIDEVLVRMRREFDAHNCNADFSQAHGRTVREPTKD